MTQVIACDITNICKKTCFQALLTYFKIFFFDFHPSVIHRGVVVGDAWDTLLKCHTKARPNARIFQRNILHRCCTRHVQVKFQAKFIVYIHLTFLTFLKISNLPPTLSLSRYSSLHSRSLPTTKTTTT